MKTVSYTGTCEYFGLIPCGPMCQVRDREAITELTTFKEWNQNFIISAA